MQHEGIFFSSMVTGSLSEKERRTYEC
jgi:hypothetical protein